MSDQVIGTGTIQIVADSTKLRAGISDAKTSLQTLRDSAKAAGESLTSSSTGYLRSLEKQASALERQAATYGQGKAGLAAFNAAQLNVSATAATLVARIAAAEQALNAQKEAAKGAAVATTALATAQQTAGVQSVAAVRPVQAAFADLSRATTTLGASSFANLDKATTSLGATATEAVRATREVNTLRTALSLAGPLATASTSLGATGPAPVRVAPIPAETGTAVATLATQSDKASTALEHLAGSSGKAEISAQALALASAKSAAAQASLATATARAGAAQSEFDKLTKSAAASQEQIAAAQLRVQSSQAAVALATERAGAAQRDATKSLDAHRTALAAVGSQSALTRHQSQQLGFQLHDFFVQIQAGQSPLTAFVQQGSQLSGTFGGAGGAFKAVASLLTPMRLAFGGIAAAIAAVGLAFHEGSKQSKEFADSLVLSGNFAGQTEGAFNSLVKTIATTTNASRSEVREFGQALIATGEIGPQVFDKATQAAVGYGKATGKTASDVAKDFASMAQGVAKWAVEHNRSLNFLTAAQILQIRAFEESGRAADAQGIVYDALNDRLKKLEPNLGVIERAARATGNAFKAMWDDALGIGRTLTVEDKLADIEKELTRRRRGIDTSEPGVAAIGVTRAGNTDDLIAKRNGLLREQGTAFAAAQKAAADAEITKNAEAAESFVSGYLKRTESVKLLNKEMDKQIEKATKAFAAKALAGDPVSPEKQAATLAVIRKDFEPKGKKGKDPAIEAEQVRKAVLDSALKTYQNQLQQEQSALAFHNEVLNAEYQSGQVSLKDFYDKRRSIAEQGLAAELGTLKDERAKLATFLEGTKDPSEREQTKTKIKEVDAKVEAAQVAAARAVIRSNQEQEASTKALNDQITEYRANLLQMAGDETGAARLRAQQAIKSAEALAKRTEGEPNAITQKQIDDQKAMSNAGIDLNKARTATTQINEVLQQQEDRIALAVKTGALTENQALQAQGEARKQVVALLEEQVKAQEALAASMPQNIQLQIDTSRARLELDKLKTELDPLKEKFDNLFKDSGASAIEGFLNNPKGGFKGAIEAFGKSISQDLNRSIGKELSGQLFGKDGIFGGAGGLFADIFGGGKKGDAAKPAIDTSAMTASLSSLQSAGIDPTISAFARLQQASDSAAGSLNNNRGASGDLTIDTSGAGTVSTPSAERDLLRGMDRSGSGEQSVLSMFRQTEDAQKDAKGSVKDLSKVSDTAAMDILTLAQAASKGGGALSLLPSIVRLAQSAFSAFSGGSSSGGGGDLLSSLFSAGLSAFSGGLTVDTSGAGNLGGISGGSILPDVLRGGRAMGGPVSAGGLYKMLEKGQPEVIEMAGQHLLWTGNQSGKVTPAPTEPSRSQVNHFTINVPQGTSRQNANAIAAEVARRLQSADARGN